MSATIFWEPRGKRKPSFDVSTPSKFSEIMNKRFGSAPWEVSEGDIQWMEGVRDAGACGADWDEIIAAVQKHGAIKIWAEH